MQAKNLNPISQHFRSHNSLKKNAKPRNKSQLYVWRISTNKVSTTVVVSEMRIIKRVAEG